MRSCRWWWVASSSRCRAWPSDSTTSAAERSSSSPSVDLQRRVAGGDATQGDHRLLDAGVESPDGLVLGAAQSRSEGDVNVVVPLTRTRGVLRRLGVARPAQMSGAANVDRDNRHVGALGQVRGASLERLHLARGRATALGVDHEVPAVLNELQRQLRAAPIHLVAVDGMALNTSTV